MKGEKKAMEGSRSKSSGPRLTSLQIKGRGLMETRRCLRTYNGKKGKTGAGVLFQTREKRARKSGRKRKERCFSFAEKEIRTRTRGGGKGEQKELVSESCSARSRRGGKASSISKKASSPDLS